MPDYIPRADEKFLEWAANLIDYAIAAKTRFHIADDVLVGVRNLENTFANALHKANLPNRGKTDVLLKNEARNILKQTLRQFVKSYLIYNPLVSNEDKINMGLPLHNIKPSPIPPPTTYPETEVDLSVIRQVHILIHEHGKLKQKKPYGVHGWELRWEILDTPPQSINEIRNSEFSTKGHHSLFFDENQRGKMIYFCVRWENNNGKKGPWSEIHNTVIP
ncbi:MAG: hypothetical protein LBI18_13625 [Planctomycetaceae bacterium]|jgi:hypothetical protein|nr:hypothetical protein [Planctomycetaceae bacterium]